MLFGADWPQWRGADRTDRSSETGLLKRWPEGGPKRVWLFREGGLGYSGFSVVKGRLFTMGARGNQEFLIVLNAEDGKELWATPVGGTYDNNWGDGPRSTPTVDGDRVYVLGAKGDLVCAAVADGKVLWKTTAAKFGGAIPGWGYCESVLVDGDQVVFTPGGAKGSMVSLDKLAGKPVWQSKDFTEAPHYSSMIPVDHNGAHQFVQLTPTALVGINSKDGAVLWRSPWNGKVAVIPTPIFHDGHVYITSGYGVGCKLVKVGANNEATDVYVNKVMKNHHGGVILVGDHLYGYSDGPGWVCQDFKTGAEVWSSKALGKGAVGYADGMLYCLEEGSGTVALAEASPKGWTEHGRFKLDPQTTQRKPEGRIWTHPVISNGKLYLRDQELVFCFDLHAR
jgi:outer membrane protein assembly factor BamB